LRALLVVTAVVLTPLVFVAASSVYERGIEDRMRRAATSARDAAVMELSAAGTADTPSERVARKLDALAATWSVRLKVIDSEGRVLFSPDHEGGAADIFGPLFFGPDGAPTLDEYDAARGALATREGVRAARAGEPSVHCRSPADGKLLVCEAFAPVRAGDDTLVAVTQVSSRRAIRALYDLRYQLLKLTLFTLPAALLLAWWLGWRMVRPIEILRRRVREKEVEPGRKADLILHRDDEVGDLARAFHELLERLDERSQENEAFVADLAHEFKNPVAAIRAAAEALSGGAADEARAQRLAKVLLDSSVRLDALVSQFLELARAEAGLAGEERSDVNLDALAEGVVGAARRDERWSGVDFEVTTDGGVSVPGIAPRLESALRNLVDNAASFAGEGGNVRVRVRRDREGARLDVLDSGPGIPAEDLPHVFDRFFTRRAGKKGTGLGLALVRAVVEAHGGTVKVEPAAGEGACFTVRLPAS
jgi:two-component system sensor histidine kinase ChvG